MANYLIAGGSVNQTPLDWKGNVKRIIDCIRQAKEKNVDILCLPELAITGYGCEDMFLSDWLWQKAISYLPEIVAECDNILVAVGLPIKIDNYLHNVACVISNGQILGFNAKQNMANDGVHYEPRWFTPWQSRKIISFNFDGKSYPFGDVIYDFKEWKIGFEICEDAWRGDGRPACRLVEQKVNLILNPSASHFAMEKSQLREDLIMDSSRDFNCTYVYANLLGNEAGRMVYDGEIMIAQHGKLLLKNELLSYKDTNLIYTSVNPIEVAASECKYETKTKDRRIEFVKAGALALFDYMRKSRSNGFILSLSGGADSSTCAVLISEMVRRGLRELGKDVFLKKINFNRSIDVEQLDSDEIDALSRRITHHLLTCAYQSTVNSSDETYASAEALATEIGAKFHQWSIDEEVNSYTTKIEQAINENLNWEEHDITLQNIQARSRAPIIWMLANLKNALLITTSNRSEGDVGYATMDGDTCGSIAPIAAVDKNFINQWLVWAQQKLGYQSLNHVNQLNPTAELRPLGQNQTDETDLMPYHIMVEIEKLAIRDHLDPLATFNKLVDYDLAPEAKLKSYISKFFRLWARNQWKRERIAPAFHLDDFNVDPRTWCRFPILSAGFTEELAALEND